MKINFDYLGNNYVEIKLGGSDKYQLSIATVDSKNPQITIVNSVELTIEQLSSLVSDLGFRFVEAEKGK